MPFDPKVLDMLVAGILARPPSVGNRVAIGIDGCGGAGKSTLAALLAERVPDCQIIHTDDFASWEEPIEWWPRMLREVFWPLREGVETRYQQYDWVTRTCDEWMPVNGRILLIEGVSSTRREFRPYLATRIWVECPRPLRLERGLLRDGAESKNLWMKWMAAEDDYIAEHQPLKGADYVISGAAGIVE